MNVEKVIVRDINKARDIEIKENALTTNPDDVNNNDKIDVIVEVIGGIDLAREYMLKAFAAKKHIITANKDLIALHGPELEKAAQENGCDLLYEASVGGGIHLLRSLSDVLVSDRIEQVMGIVNRTKYYILKKNDEEGQTYEDSISDAKILVFSETNPIADVQCLDADRNMVNLARLSFLTDVEMDDFDLEGVSELSI